MSKRLLSRVGIGRSGRRLRRSYAAMPPSKKTEVLIFTSIAVSAVLLAGYAVAG